MQISFTLAGRNYYINTQGQLNIPAQQIDSFIATVKDKLQEIKGKLDKFVAKGGNPLEITDKQDFNNMMLDFVACVEELNSLHAKRAVRIINFVEGMEDAILDEGNLPKELFDEQVEIFSELYKGIKEDYVKINKEYFK